MIDGKFDVVFRGQIVRSMDESDVKSNLVTLFKSSPEAVDKLFGGNEVVVRKDLDYATAMKYQSALKKAGALALIKEIEPKPDVAQSSQGKATFGVQSEEGADSSAKQSNLQTSEQTNTDASQHTVAGELSEDKTEPQVQAAQPSSEDSATSLDALTVAEPGAQILPDKVYEKRDVDTSQLSLASAGERILPQKPPETHKQPSIDHLKLEE